jgi:hypothetical protein
LFRVPEILTVLFVQAAIVIIAKIHRESLLIININS